MATDPRWLNDDEQDLWQLMLAVSRKIDRGIDETLLGGSELSISEFAVLAELSAAGDDALRLRDLCAKLDWDRSRTSHQITRMERRGLVTKHKSEGDARGVTVELTAEGIRRLEYAAPEHVESVRRLIFDHLHEEDLPALRRFLVGVMDVDNVPGVGGFTGTLSEVNPQSGQ